MAGTFYPTKGTLFDAIGDFFDHPWGSRRRYQTYKLSFSAYREIADNQVIAYQARGCSANGNVPLENWMRRGHLLVGYGMGKAASSLTFSMASVLHLRAASWR